jgi:hypothetical protein
MKKSVQAALYVVSGTLMSSLAGYILVGSRIFHVQSQFFHFILAGFCISLMWVDEKGKKAKLIKGIILLAVFLLYRLSSDQSFTFLIGRDIVYFIIFFMLSFIPPVLWSRIILNKPIIRFLGSGLAVSAVYSLSAVILDYMYPTAAAPLFDLVKVNGLYGLTIGMAVSLGLELIHAFMSGFHAKSID